jgi:transcriptional regulator with XRE-family HTH domain
MTLSEKLLICRKKAGMSQEELAQKLDVSRQAVSKWECGEAIPETSKLVSLAGALGVTVDWLLSEDPLPDRQPSVQEEIPQTLPPLPEGGAAESRTAGAPAWIEHLPQFLRRVFLRWGWLCGVYVALGGLGFMGVGTLVKVLSAAMVDRFTSVTESMLGAFPSFGGGEIEILDGAGNPITGEEAQAIREAIGSSGAWGSPFGDPFETFTDSAAAAFSNSPVEILANVLLILGVLMLIAGIVLAVLLRKWGKKHADL